ncbi:MAG: phosphatidylglycerol lysyltransferase domain-containing protein [Patescibacteria group bacterium]|nr:phosphatidylglycerol lysyltransferase domain-containing protein [Patescibacteria group bacterium]
MKGMIFKNFSLEDKETIDPYLSKYYSSCLSVFTFSTFMSWGSIYRYKWAIANDTLLIKFTEPEDRRDQLVCPIGEFPKKLQDEVIEYARSLEYELKIYGVSEEFIGRYVEFVSHFERVDRRDMDNYIYLAESLALLEGRKYQPKRNLLSQFEKNYKWTSESISSGNISDCFAVMDNIYGKRDLGGNLSISQELESLDFVLNNFEKLKEEGILIRIDGKPVAFSIYEPINSLMCAVHYEKAEKEYRGLYQLINRETAKKILSEGYKYINREEDLGIEGLRKAKLSYYPIKMCPAFVLVFKK